IGVGRPVGRQEGATVPVGAVRGGVVQQQGVDEDHAARGRLDGHRERRVGGVGADYLAAEVSVDVMVGEATVVGARYHLEGRVLGGGVVEVDEGLHQVGVGMGVVGEVLVPFHHTAHLRG